MKVKNNAFVPGIFNLMDRFLTDDFQGNHYTARPAVNILEGEKMYALEVMAPGMKKDDFKISIEGDLLTISFQKEEVKEEATVKYIRKEFVTSSFQRTFTLNEKLNTEGIVARYEDGVLTIEIPKVEVKKDEVKQVIIN